MEEVSQLGRESATGAEHERPREAWRTVRIAAASDLHARSDRPDRLRRIFRSVSEEADLLLLGGDLTDHGAPSEAEMLAEELTVVRIPVVAVLGNHDHEQGKQEDVVRILGKAGVHVLDGDVFVYQKRLGIAGVKGFGGGFDEATLEPWGEEMVKRFVFEAVNESLKLETALARLRSFERRVALLHYSPVRETVVGENPEIAAFLGCSRLVDPIDKFGASAAIHGHAHRGRLEGRTPRGIPVYNTAMELLDERLGRRYALIEI